MSPPRGVLLVGSTGHATAETAFRECTTHLPSCLKRLPDGETGIRTNFTIFQSAFFSTVPEMMTEFKNNTPIPARDCTPNEVAAGVAKLQAANPGTGYDDAALESYATFAKLKDEGVIPGGTKFQVCIPGISSVILPFVQRDFQAAAAPVYEKALFAAMRRIQEGIPDGELAVQVDLAADTALWEDVEMYRPWFFRGKGELKERREYLVEMVVNMIGQVEEGVEVGVHNCYGDMDHRHWMEPESLKAITERGVALFEKSPRPIKFWHVPVPLSAMGKLEEYYQPMTALIPKFKEHGTELYLGLVHYGDPEGTKERIEVAKKVFGEFGFGVATECGFGRTPKEQVVDIMKLSAEVCEAVV